MKTLFFTIVLFINVLNPVDPPTNTLTLAKHLKVQSTFSGKTLNNNSFHVIVAKNKNTKKYDLIPVKHSNGQLEMLQTISFDENPAIISFHNNDDVVSLVASTKGKKHDNFNVVDIDFSTGKSNKSNNISGENYKTAIRKDHESLLLFSTEDELRVLNIKNTASQQTITVKPKVNENILKDLKDGSIEAVKTDEFVANGSIGNNKLYALDDDLIITVDDKDKGNTSVITIPLDEGETANFYKKDYKDNNETKKSASYVQGDKLYQLKLDKERGAVNIYDLDSDKDKTLNLSSIKISKKSKGFSDVQDFLKKAAKNNNEPTVTVNATKSGNVVMRADYVLKTSYSYNYNWWWHHVWWQHQLMQFQQQQMINQARQNIPRFGPSPVNDIYIPLLKEEKHYFEVLLDAESNVLSNDDYEPVYSDTDKKHYIDKINDDKSFDFASTVFFDDTFRYFVFDKKTKSFMIFDKQLDD